MNDTCKTCLWKNKGCTVCLKSGKPISKDFGCGEYDFKRSKDILKRFFTEAREVRENNRIYREVEA